MKQPIRRFEVQFVNETLERYQTDCAFSSFTAARSYIFHVMNALIRQKHARIYDNRHYREIYYMLQLTPTTRR